MELNTVLFSKPLHNHGCKESKFKKPVIECCNPRFIVNPCLPELISKFGYYHFAGIDYFVENRHRFGTFYKFNLKPFQSFLDNLTTENFQEHYVVDTDTGEFYPIYMCVPCGQCDLCNEKKVNSFVQRIKYESFMYPFKPIFVTLTYADKYLPSDGVSIRDCQLFLKRFRQRLLRSGYTQRIRYALCSEYGKKTHRAHYHAIFFGLPLRTDNDMRHFEQLLRLSWSNGFILAREIDMRNSATAYYTAKYMRKRNSAPAGSNPTFMLSSRGHGGLGSAFFRLQSKMLRKKVQREFDVLNKWTYNVEPFRWSAYALDKIYPSVSKYIPLELRKAVKRFMLSYTCWKFLQPEFLWLFESNYELIKRKYTGLFYFPDVDTCSFHDVPLMDYDNIMADIYECERIISKYNNVDFSDALSISKQRELLLANIALDRLDIDLVQKVSRIKRNIKRLETLEKL